MSKDLQELTAKIARRLELSKHTATVKYIRSGIETFIAQNYTRNTEVERRVKIAELEIALSDAEYQLENLEVAYAIRQVTENHIKTNAYRLKQCIKHYKQQLTQLKEKSDGKV